VNGGETWSTVGVPTTGTVVDASFPSAGVGYAIDALGGAFKTVNGGGSWQVLSTGSTSAPSAVLATGPNDLLLAGPTGLRRSTDGGSSFTAIGDKDVKKAKINHVDPAGAGAIVAWGRGTVAVSSDGGATWKRIELPKKAKVADASFLSDSLGYILSKGQLLRTRNAGRKWKDRPAIGTGGAYGISFSSADEGFVTARGFGDSGLSGVVMHTTNGGGSFQPQVISGEAPSDLYDAGPTAFAITPSASFFATGTGGAAGTPSALTLQQVGGPKAARAMKKGKIKVTGTLAPAEGGEKIAIMYRDNKRWRTRTEVAATNGVFTSAFKVKRETVAVAQWLGDDTRAGAGTSAVRVKPKKKKG
jgi:hypothetical protein